MYERILVQDIYSKIISFNRILKNSLSLVYFLEVSTKSFAKQLNIILHALNKRNYL